MTAMITDRVLDAAIGHEHADLYRSCLFLHHANRGIPILVQARCKASAGRRKSVFECPSSTEVCIKDYRHKGSSLKQLRVL